MRFFLRFTFLFLVIFGAQEAFAFGDDVLKASGKACEKVKDKESVSSTRLRASDKASFKAVSNLDIMTAVKEKLGDHNFNVMVYQIVDNLLEDVSMNTVKQDSSEICVETEGYLDGTEVLRVIADYSFEREIKTKSVEDKKEEKPSAVIVKEEADKKDEDITLVYVAPTEFYDNTKSNKHAKILKDKFSESNAFEITNNEKEASYIVKSKVLRAKVDAINNSTNRLQMVIAVELHDVKNSKTLMTEHQNRFVLFNEMDNEQEVAYKLLKKLISNAGEVAMSKIEVKEKEKIKTSFLSPA